MSNPHPITTDTYVRMGRCIGGIRLVPESEMAKLEERLRREIYATETAKDLLIETLFIALHQQRPYYAELAAKDKREPYQHVHDGNLNQSRAALDAYDQYKEEQAVAEL